MAAPIDHAAVLLAAVLTLLAGPALASAAGPGSGSGLGPGSGAPPSYPSGMRDNLINDNTPVTRAQMAAYSDELQAVADGFEAAKREYLQGQCSMFEAAPDMDMDAALGSGIPSDPGSVNTIPAEPAASPACVAFSSQDFDATCQDPTSSMIHGVCSSNSWEMAGMGVWAGNGVLFATAAMSGEAVAPFFDNEFAVNYLNTCEDDDMGSVRCGTASVSADLEDVVVYGLRNQGEMDFTEPTNALSRMTVLVGTVQEQSALPGTDRPQLTVNGGVLACVDTHNEGRFTAARMEKLSVKGLANFERFTVDDSNVVVMTHVTNDGTIKISPNTASVADTTNRGDFAATVQDSAHFADFVNENGGHLTLSEASQKGSTFSIDTITNAGEVQVTGGALTACGVTNSAGGSMAVLDTAIGTMHILENSGDLNFTGSYGNVVLVDGATRGSVTGDANINWVLNGQDCDVGASFAPTPSPPTNQYTWSRAPTAYVPDDLGFFDPSTGKSRDDESSSTGYVVAIVLATVAALGLMAVVIRRQAQQSTTPRGKKSARVSPASMDGIILTSMDHVAAVEDAKTAASAKRATVRVTAIAAAALSSPEDKPVAAAPSSLAPAGDRMSTRRSSEVITLAVTPMSSPMVSRRTRRMSEDIIMLAPSPAASPKLLRGNKAGSISTATNKPTTRSSTRLVTATTR